MLFRSCFVLLDEWANAGECADNIACFERDFWEDTIGFFDEVVDLVLCNAYSVWCVVKWGVCGADKAVVFPRNDKKDAIVLFGSYEDCMVVRHAFDNDMNAFAFLY